jgi:hypothetical protein
MLYTFSYMIIYAVYLFLYDYLLSIPFLIWLFTQYTFSYMIIYSVYLFLYDYLRSIPFLIWLFTQYTFSGRSYVWKKWGKAKYFHFAYSEQYQ